MAISSSITSGGLGRLAGGAHRSDQPGADQLGQVATTALSQTVNSQQAVGLDLNGKFGAAIFSVGTPQVTALLKNTDATTAAVSVTAWAR